MKYRIILVYSLSSLGRTQRMIELPTVWCTSKSFRYPWNAYYYTCVSRIPKSFACASHWYIEIIKWLVLVEHYRAPRKIPMEIRFITSLSCSFSYKLTYSRTFFKLPIFSSNICVRTFVVIQTIVILFIFIYQSPWI